MPDYDSDIARLATGTAFSAVGSALRQRLHWIEQTQINLTSISAPTFEEAKRAAAVADLFRQLGLARVHIDAAGNVVGERTGEISDCVAVTAHIDTVVPRGTAIDVRRVNGRIYAPGITDNGAGLAALLGAAAALHDAAVATKRSILFVANVGEEGEGDLHGMRFLLAQPDCRSRVRAMLIIDGAAIDHITVAALGSRRFLIEVAGPGGHSWKDFGRVNPIAVLSRAVVQLSQLPLPSAPRTTLNVGLIHGGTTVNSIPSTAWMKVDIRSTVESEIERVSGLLETTMREAIEAERARGSGELTLRIVKIGDRPAGQLPSDSALLRTIRSVDRHLAINSRLECSSTDANIPLAMGIEAVAIGGGGRGGDAHTANEWYEPQDRELGLRRILLLLLAVAGLR